METDSKSSIISTIIADLYAIVLLKYLAIGKFNEQVAVVRSDIGHLFDARSAEAKLNFLRRLYLVILGTLIYYLLISDNYYLRISLAIATFASVIALMLAYGGDRWPRMMGISIAVVLFSTLYTMNATSILAIVGMMVFVLYIKSKSKV